MRILFIFLTLFIFGLQSYSQSKEYVVSCVGFYNLENLYDTIDDPKTNDEEFLPTGAKLYTGSLYKEKLNHMATVIGMMAKELTPDGIALLGVAEVENRLVLEDLCKQPELSKNNFSIVHFDSKDYRGVDVGLLYNPKYFTPEHSEALFVPLPSRDTIPNYTRDILYVYGKFDGEPMHFFVNHWPSRRGGEEASAPRRALASSIARAKIDSILAADPNAKIVLMGDLNDDPVSPSLVKVMKSQGNASKMDNNMMFNPWTNLYKNGIGTLAWNDSWNLFDQVLISNKFLQREQNGFFYKQPVIFNKDFMCQHTGNFKGYPLRTFVGNEYAGGYADHFPVYVVLLKEKK